MTPVRRTRNGRSRLAGRRRLRGSGSVSDSDTVRTESGPPSRITRNSSTARAVRGRAPRGTAYTGYTKSMSTYKRLSHCEVTLRGAIKSLRAEGVREPDARDGILVSEDAGYAPRAPSGSKSSRWPREGTEGASQKDMLRVRRVCGVRCAVCVERVSGGDCELSRLLFPPSCRAKRATERSARGAGERLLRCLLARREQHLR